MKLVRWTALLLALDAALLLAFVLQPALAPRVAQDFFARFHRPDSAEAQRLAAESSAAAARRVTLAAAAAARAPSQLWSDLYSADLPTFVARLRAAGFPPFYLRALVNAELSRQFLPRHEELAHAADDQPYWKTSHHALFNARQAYDRKDAALQLEQQQRLRDLVGDDAFASPPGFSDVQRRQYGDLPRAKADAVARINADYAEMVAQFQASTQGISLPEDVEKFALLQRERQRDLAAALTPDELADYEMRTSPLTRELQPALTLMNGTADEFRTLYGIAHAYADRLLPPAGTETSTDQMEHDKAAAKQAVLDQFQAALGPDRFAEFARAGNYEFQQLTQLTRQQNLPDDTAVRAWAVRDQTAARSSQIFDDSSLTPDAKRAALAALAQDTRAQLLGTLGSTAGNAFIDRSNWLVALAAGDAISFPVGGGQIYLPLPPPQTGK